MVLTACTAPGPPAFPEAISAPLVGPLCERPGQPCQCTINTGDVGTPSPGTRRFEVRLPPARGTSSALVIDGFGALLRDEANPEGSCFYLDLSPGATYRMQYLAQAAQRERGITVAFSMRELSPDGRWYDVIQQRCGSNDEPCHYESVSDWTQAVSGGHRFHDPCGSTYIEGIQVEGGLYDRTFIDSQFTFGLILREEDPPMPPGSPCRRDPDGNLIMPEPEPEEEAGEVSEEVSDNNIDSADVE